MKNKGWEMRDGKLGTRGQKMGDGEQGDERMRTREREMENVEGMKNKKPETEDGKQRMGNRE